MIRSTSGALISREAARFSLRVVRTILRTCNIISPRATVMAKPA